MEINSERIWRRQLRTVAPMLVMILIVAACSSSDDDPATVLADYVEARNSGDVDAVMALYAEDAVVNDHPLDPDGVATGADAIRALEEQVPAVQGSGDGIELVDMEVSGNTVLFSSRFFYGADGTRSGGSAGCAGSVRNSVTVEDAKITLWDPGSESPTMCG